MSMADVSEIQGYTLPVWVAAAARAAVIALQGKPFSAEQPLQLDLQAPEDSPSPIPVVAAAPLGEGRALAVARCEPGPGLDLTRGLVVWVEASWGAATDPDGDWLQLLAGEGAGIHAATGELCVSAYARQLLERNLRPLVPEGERLTLRLILPSGRRLAERTSNAAFGVVEGLALIGTQAMVKSSAAPEQLEACLQTLAERCRHPGFDGDLVLVIGENGLDLAPTLGVPVERLLKVGHWIGPVLVAAAAAGVRRLLLFGYQGKLLKLAGGIFHTHHHLADGRAEVLTALAALEGLSGAALQRLHAAATVEEALTGLEADDPELAARLRLRVATAIETRCRAYLARHGQQGLQVGAVLFDRSRTVRACGPLGSGQWGAFRRQAG
ncbi:MAG: cobalt-precorrin-5B (C(1))-methyltransferase CbiD [Cyanobacteriota bacterium]